MSRCFRLFTLAHSSVLATLLMAVLPILSPAVHAQDADDIIEEMHEQANYWTPQRQQASCMGAYYAAMRARAAQNTAQANQQAIAEQQRDQQAMALQTSGQNAMADHNYLTAISMFWQQLRLNPNDGTVKSSLARAENGEGCALFATGDFDGALNYFQNALAYAPGDAVMLANLAKAQQQLRLRAAAQAARRADEQAARKMQNLIQQSSGNIWYVPADESEAPLSPNSDSMLWDSDVVDLRGANTDVVNIGVAQSINPTVPPSLSDLPNSTVGQAGPVGQTTPTPPLFIPPATQDEAQAMVKKLDTEIDAIKKQLAALGFTARSQDFDQIGASATEAEQEFVKRLRDQVAELVADAIADQGKDLLGEGIEGEEGVKVESLIKDLEDGGFPPDAVEEAVAKAFPDAAGRINVADTVLGGIEVKDKLETVGEARDLYNKNTIESQQESLLKALSVVDAAKPAVEMARTAYTVGDAGFSLIILSGEQRQLDTQTGQQLANLKIVSDRMKSLVIQRNAVQAMMAKLPR